MSKCCKNFKLQGHKKAEYFVLHLELKMHEEKKKVEDLKQLQKSTRTLTSGKVVKPPNLIQEVLTNT